jgi:hypothetical protein
MDIGTCSAQVVGLGSVTLLHIGHDHPDYDRSVEENGSGLAEINRLRGGHVHIYPNGERFPLGEIGPFHPAEPETYLPPEVWQRALEAAQREQAEATVRPPEEVLMLLEERQTARLNKQWERSDALRNQIQSMGWLVKDTRDGMEVERKLS